MEIRDLETTLEAALAVTRPTARDVRDALVDYFATVARPFVLRGLSYTEPAADDATIRRLLMLRLGTLWHDLPSSWDQPTLQDLGRFRERIEQYACVKENPALGRSRRLLDDLMLAATVSERLETLKARRTMRRLEVFDGGCEVSPPRGQLRLVRPERIAPVTTETG